MAIVLQNSNGIGSIAVSVRCSAGIVDVAVGLGPVAVARPAIVVMLRLLRFVECCCIAVQISYNFQYFTESLITIQGHVRACSTQLCYRHGMY